MNISSLAKSNRADLPAPGPRLRQVVPADTIACPECQRRLGLTRYKQQLRVCSWCGHHGRVPATERIEQIATPDSVQIIGKSTKIDERDPLGFNDGLPYKERLAQAREKSGEQEAMVAARASLGATSAPIPVIITSMEFGFFGGSLGSAAGEVFAKACDVAVAESRPLIAVCISGGARMQEGIASLAQMARCTNGVAQVMQAGLPYLTILADPCYGGVTASFAVQADVILAEPKARIGFAGGRVIEQAAGDKLPEGFQTAEFLLEHGMVDLVINREELRPTISRLLEGFTAHGR